LPPSNGSQLQDLLKNLYDPSSPLYHRWLQPGQFDQEFGPSASDVAGVESWLHSVGLTHTSASGFAVNVSAPASQISSALSTPFERYKTPTGHQGYLAQRVPLVPQSLAGGQVSAILGLNTVSSFQSQSTLTPSVSTGARVLQPQADGLTACSAAQYSAEPGYYTLDNLGAAYGVGSLLSDGQNGHGETVGLYELASSSSSDVATYESCFGLTNPVSVSTVDGGGGAVGGSGTEEADADIEQVATQAPDASIISYEGPSSGTGPYDTWRAIVQADAAQVISTSWGICEPLAASDGYISSFSTLLEEAAAQGQTVLAASGDSGSEGCYTPPSDTSTTLDVDYPASDPSVTGVGGTELLGPGDEVTWPEGGGGISRYFSDPSWQPVDWSWTTSVNSCGLDCREVPDISANAGVGMVIYEDGTWAVVGGTSLSAPLVAGIVSDRNDGCTSTTADWAPSLYGAAAQGLYGSGLTDITSGNNDATDTYGGADYPASVGYDPATGLGSPIASGLSCPEVTGVSTGSSGSQVSVSGLGLEHATIDFGASPAQVVSASATSATVVVPSGSGTVSVHASSLLGTGTQATSFTYGTPSSASAPTTSTATTPTHGYWLVGSDGGIFSFGSAQFYGSTGSLVLQRPVVGIVPTKDHGGYWLDASDGGVFSFGDTQFYGSIPGLGLHPAGSGLPNSLNAPIVGMVPSIDDGGYFMVASDGGVFAFGDAHFAGSCPGIGGCAGAAVAVMPDASGKGYWLVTQSGNVYTFGDAHYDGAPGNTGSPVTSAVRTPDGGGYWILTANGHVYNYGDAANYGSPSSGSFSVLNPATAVFTTSDGAGYWVSSAAGQIFNFGDAPNDGDTSATHLNGAIIAGTGF